MITRFFRSLRGKLILTYTLVTVLALLALELLVLIVLVGLTDSVTSNRAAYLSDVIYTLYPQARNYLQPGEEDLPNLQAWVEQVYASGYASLEPQDALDSPAAPIVLSSPMLVLSPDRLVLAQANLTYGDFTGSVYAPPDVQLAEEILVNALAGNLDPLWLSTEAPGGYLLAVPVLQGGRETPVVGVIILTVAEPPPALTTLWPVLVGGVVVTGVILLLAVAPLGALFGFVMSHGLTRRLKALSEASDAWSEGDFSRQPQDRSQDEIGYLALRMRRMAERIQALLQTQQQLAALEERNRLARDLHDTVKQQAFATLMQVRSAKNLLESDPAKARAHLEEAESLVKLSQQELGLLIAELRPAALDGQGLARALEQYLQTWSAHTRIPADFQVQNERTLPLAVEQAFYRVAQEALSNVARHSRASAATVRLQYASRELRLIVADNGQGFEPDSAVQSGIGLQSMRERLVSLGGDLSVESANGEGVILTARVPLNTMETKPHA